MLKKMVYAPKMVKAYAYTPEHKTPVTVKETTHMGTRTYSRQQVADIAGRYHGGDPEAGRTVDALARGYQRDHGGDYAAAVHAVLRTHESTEDAPRPQTTVSFHEAQREIEKWTVKLMADLAVDRRTAVKLACGLCPDHYGPVYTGHPVKRLSADRVYREYQTTIDPPFPSGIKPDADLTRAATLANSIPKTSDGRNWTRIAQTAGQHLQTFIRAAEQMARLLKASGRPVPADLSNLMNGTVTVAGVQSLFPEWR